MAKRKFTVNIGGSKFKTFMAVSCTHGKMINKKCEKAFFEFADSFNPELKIHLGDVFDLPALRKGAGPEEMCIRIEDDMQEGFRFLRRYRPDILTLGNHDKRLYDLAGKGPAVQRELGEHLVQRAENVFDETTRKWVKWRNHDIVSAYGWKFHHGFTHSRHSDAKNADVYGYSMNGHIHRLGQQTGGRYEGSRNVSVGCLVDIMKCEYAETQLSKYMWENGFVFGALHKDNPSKSQVIPFPLGRIDMPNHEVF